MPIQTARPTARAKTGRADRPGPALQIVVACLFAGVEFAAALVLGRFLDLGRAEPLLFFAFRPWILFSAALAVLRWGARDRATFYLALLLIAYLSENLFLLALGATDPWSSGLRGLLAGAALVALFDLVLSLGRRGRRIGLAAGSLAILAVLTIPGALRPYEALLLPSTERLGPPKRPGLMLFTGLPIIWGEAGAFDPQSRPAAAYKMLQREFGVRPLDALEPPSLSRGNLLLLAQPRALAPAELVALDEWVRRGGRALVLIDPALVWPSELPLGDIRRPPPISMIDPLLNRWGLQLEAVSEHGVVRRSMPGGRRLATAAPGRFSGRNSACRTAEGGLIARCRIGVGRVTLLGDADLMHDALWLPEGGRSDPRSRAADNPLLVSDLLDELAGRTRDRTVAPIQWIREGAPFGRAVLIGLAPLLLLILAGLLLPRVSRG